MLAKYLSILYHKYFICVCVFTICRAFHGGQIVGSLPLEQPRHIKRNCTLSTTQIHIHKRIQ